MMLGMAARIISSIRVAGSLIASMLRTFSAAIETMMTMIA